MPTDKPVRIRRSLTSTVFGSGHKPGSSACSMVIDQGGIHCRFLQPCPCLGMAGGFVHFMCSKLLFAGIGNGYLLFAGRHHCLPAFCFLNRQQIPKPEGGEDRQQAKTGSPSQAYAARGRTIPQFDTEMGTASSTRVRRQRRKAPLYISYAVQWAWQGGLCQLFRRGFAGCSARCGVTPGTCAHTG